MGDGKDAGSDPLRESLFRIVYAVLHRAYRTAALHAAELRPRTGPQPGVPLRRAQPRQPQSRDLAVHAERHGAGQPRGARVSGSARQRVRPHGSRTARLFSAARFGVVGVPLCHGQRFRACAARHGIPAAQRHRAPVCGGLRHRSHGVGAAGGLPGKTACRTV